MDVNELTISTGRKPWQFGPGNNANPTGRPKGSRNKLGEDFLRAMQEDFATNGVQAIEEVRTQRPHEYLKVIASILPKQIELKEGSFDGFSDEQLASLVYAARSALSVIEGSGAGETNQGNPQSVIELQAIPEAAGVPR